MLAVPSEANYDVVIIGAGVVGTAIAREFSRYRLRTALLEKQPEPSFGTSKANSGIVHAGFHSPPGTLKSSLCVRGVELYPELVSDLDVEYKQNGTLMVAFAEEEKGGLHTYLEQGRAASVPHLELVERESLSDLEPNLSDRAVLGLLAPTGGVVSPFELTIAQAENAADNGVDCIYDCAVTDLESAGDRVCRVTTTRGSFTAALVVNAAGLFADKISNLAGDYSFSIQPRKGEEYLLDKRLEGIVQRTIFPLPTPVSKGILVIPTVHGNLMLGPTAEETDDRSDLSTSFEGFQKIFSMCSKMVEGIQPSSLIATFAGLRPASDRDDFVIEVSEAKSNLVNVGGIESPGLTAAPAIAEMVLDMCLGLLDSVGVEIKENREFNGVRSGIRRFRLMSEDERRTAVNADRRFASVVCRCELVTEAEIRDAVRRGARTLDGVKLRTRAGMGRCQGGFCTSRIIKILHEELGTPLDQLTKRGSDSRILMHRTKSLFSDEELSAE